MADTPDTIPSSSKRKADSEDRSAKRQKKIDTLLENVKDLEETLKILRPVPNISIPRLNLVHNVLASIRSGDYKELYRKVLSRQFEIPKWPADLSGAHPMLLPRVSS